MMSSNVKLDDIVELLSRVQIAEGDTFTLLYDDPSVKIPKSYQLFEEQVSLQFCKSKSYIRRRHDNRRRQPSELGEIFPSGADEVCRGPSNSLAHATPFQHIPLSSSHDYIHLLQIKGQQLDGILDCKMVNMSMDEQRKYAALSYVWGNPNPRSAYFVQWEAVCSQSKST